MSDTSDVVIVGGGAAGCATAYYLAKAGVKPTIVERDGVANMASGFSAGGLNPLQGAGIPGPLSTLAMASFRLHQQIWAELIKGSDVDFDPKLISVVRVAFDEREIDDLTETYRIFESAGNGFSARWLDAAQLREIEPRIASGSVRSLEIYGNAILSSYRYTLALARAAEKLGAVFRSDEAVGVKSTGDRISSIVLHSGEVECESVVFATGPWSDQIEGWLGVRIPVEPLKGEILRMSPPGGPLLDRDFEGAGVSLFHREEGQVWVGATEERKGFDAEPSASARDSLMAGARRLMPAMADAELVLHTACLRPVTPDWLPIIGRAPGWANAYLATGAGKKGILISPGMGKAVADLITTGVTELPVEGFALDRFSA